METDCEEFSIPIHESETYPTDFDDPPFALRDPSLILIWYTNQTAREIMSRSPWKDLIRRGDRPYFCLHEGFCACLKSNQELKQHYQDFESHRLSRTHWQSIVDKAKVIHYLRKWNFPRQHRRGRKDDILGVLIDSYQNE